MGENQTVRVGEIADRLYALPTEEFTRARNQAERELRKAGEREQADRVKALRKPTAAAGAANRLVRGHRPEVDAFLAAAATLRDAQVSGKGNIASAAIAQREALEKLVGLGGESVRATLQAAAVDDNTARDLLAAPARARAGASWVRHPACALRTQRGEGFDRCKSRAWEAGRRHPSQTR